MLPIVAAQRVQPVKSDHALNDLVRLVPTPGHSIDHFCVQVGRHGEDAIITGDMVHTPLQVRYPEIGTIADYDARQAGETRLKLFDQICETSTLLCTAHFPSPSIGRIVRRASTFDFTPITS